jgi:hypothetical protein
MQTARAESVYCNRIRDDPADAAARTLALAGSRRTLHESTSVVACSAVWSDFGEKGAWIAAAIVAECLRLVHPA